ncbi:hypothetical protein N7527_002853 [Penicillium freii]|nr:hypothetical protein N7527_002853 [Penicillium freii]
MRDERDILDLYVTDYQPVWAAGIEFPGVTPEERSQYLYEDGKQVSLFIRVFGLFQFCLKKGRYQQHS